MEHLSLKEKAYRIIKEKLLKMEFEPGGRIREDLLAEEISMSRTPVREAINQLTAEGFINNIPRRGLFFIKIRQEEIKDLLDVREVLEILAVDKCIEKISAEQIKNLERILDEIERSLKAGAYGHCNELDSLFHQEIAKISRNKKLIDFCHDLEDYMHIARAIEKEKYTQNKIKRSHEEHRLIVKCIKNKDKLGAKKAIRNNIMSMKRNLGI
ncbi:MAG: GntR family transcriptional regulator [Candidatus Aminicenantes bacterium]|nr:GntR family transcriptional regulator [Candidatus Aminicenantes bacterium]